MSEHTQTKSSVNINLPLTREYLVEDYQRVTRNGLLAVCLSVGALVSLIGVARTPQLVDKTIMGLLGGTLAASAFVMSSQREHEKEQLEELSLLIRQTRLNRLYDEQNQVNNQTNTNGLPRGLLKPGVFTVKHQWFDWSVLRDVTMRRNFPHLLIAGATGAGKTTLAEWLCGELTSHDDGSVLNIAVTPHYKPGDFRQAHVVVGVGRNFGHDARPYEVVEKRTGQIIIGEYELPFSDFSNPAMENPTGTIAQFFNALMREMNTRYQLLSRGVLDLGSDTHPTVNMFLDEFPSYSGLPGVRDIMKKLVLEARKVGIRLFVLTQGLQVKTLGIEGESDLRANIVCVRLGRFAFTYAKTLYDKTRHDAERSEWVGTLTTLQQLNTRAAMVDDTPAEVPVIDPANLPVMSPTQTTNTNEPTENTDVVSKENDSLTGDDKTTPVDGTTVTEQGFQPSNTLTNHNATNPVTGNDTPTSVIGDVLLTALLDRDINTITVRELHRLVGSNKYSSSQVKEGLEDLQDNGFVVLTEGMRGSFTVTLNS